MRGDERSLIDTNLLAYAFDSRHPEKQVKSRKLLEEMKLSEKWVVSSQNLAELFWFLTTRAMRVLTKREAAQAVAGFVEAPYIEKINYSHETVKRACALVAASDSHFWDALLAETMLENGVQRVYTENEKHFNKISGISAINPLK